MSIEVPAGGPHSGYRSTGFRLSIKRHVPISWRGFGHYVPNKNNFLLVFFRNQIARLGEKISAFILGGGLVGNRGSFFDPMIVKRFRHKLKKNFLGLFVQKLSIFNQKMAKISKKMLKKRLPKAVLIRKHKVNFTKFAFFRFSGESCQITRSDIDAQAQVVTHREKLH